MLFLKYVTLLIFFNLFSRVSKFLKVPQELSLNTTTPDSPTYWLISRRKTFELHDFVITKELRTTPHAISILKGVDYKQRGELMKYGRQIDFHRTNKYTTRFSSKF